MADETLSWSEAKNLTLQLERGLSFEEVEGAIEDGRVLDDIPHPNSLKFPNQRMLIVRIGDQVCIVPYVTDGKTRFLKTIYPSRKAKRIYSGR
jgi:hypothetical protein